jgi:hypothetical protein
MRAYARARACVRRCLRVGEKPLHERPVLGALGHLDDPTGHAQPLHLSSPGADVGQSPGGDVHGCAVCVCV